MYYRGNVVHCNCNRSCYDWQIEFRPTFATSFNGSSASVGPNNRFSCSAYREIRYCVTVSLHGLAYHLVTRSWSRGERSRPRSNVSRGIEILIVPALSARPLDEHALHVKLSKRNNLSTIPPTNTPPRTSTAVSLTVARCFSAWRYRGEAVTSGMSSKHHENKIL